MITCLDALEQGYLIFPYILWSCEKEEYVQIPVHRDGLYEYFERGLFLPWSLERSDGYFNAIVNLFACIWKKSVIQGDPLDLYLVFSSNQCWHLAPDFPEEKCQSPVFSTSIPSGGSLYSMEWEILRTNQPHFVI